MSSFMSCHVMSCHHPCHVMSCHIIHCCQTTTASLFSSKSDHCHCSQPLSPHSIVTPINTTHSAMSPAPCTHCWSNSTTLTIPWCPQLLPATPSQPRISPCPTLTTNDSTTQGRIRAKIVGTASSDMWPNKLYVLIFMSSWNMRYLYTVEPRSNGFLL